MARQRNFKAEYERRLAKAAARGLSRSQARGHARAGEAPIRKPKTIKSDEKLEAALKALRQTGNQASAAKEAGVAPERFRRFVRENSLAKRRGKRWHITDQRARRMTVLSNGEAREITLRDFEQASFNGKHLAAVGAFLRTNDPELLRPFEGQSVIDSKSKPHPLETDPNALHRIGSAGSDVFEQIYRLIQ